jgi:restriction system protein
MTMGGAAMQKTISSMSALDAALKVLQNTGKPLHYREITRRVLAQGLWESEGKTPAATINARLAVDVKKNGPASPFRRAGRGIFALNTAGPPGWPPGSDHRFL